MGGKTMKNKYIYSFLILIIIVPLICGCTIFRRPTGIWVCEELGITVDFDDDGGLNYASITSIGMITINGETREIVCGMDPIGSANFLYIEEVGKHSSERSYIYHGTFKNDGENQMIFKPVRSEEKYIFVKQE